MFHVSRLWRLFLLVPVLLLAARAQGPARTTINDTVYQADGSPAQGTLLIFWPAFTTASGAAVAPGTSSVTLGTGGALSVALVPSQGATPVNTVYTVVYQLSDIVKTEYWSVPTTSPTNLATVRITLGASSAASQMVTQQYVEAAVAVKANDSSVVHLAGNETITGTKQFSAPPSFPTPMQSTDAANKAYVDSSVQNVGGGGPYVSTAGGTMSGPLTLSGDPAAANQAANKHYVDSWSAVKADLIGGLVPASELASGTPGAGTCLLGNQTWGSCGGGSSSSVNSTQVASPNFNSTVPAAQSSFLNCSFRNTGSNVSLECPYGNTSSSFALGSQAVLNNQANSYAAGLQDFSTASLKLPAGASYAPAVSGAVGFDTTANMPVINVNGTTQQVALTTSNISGQASTALALAATPAQCNGSFATGIQANGNANCSTADVVQLAETAQPSGISNYGIFWFDSTTHTPRVIDNNGQVAQLGLMNAFNSDANTLEEYNGTNPQTLNVYGTRADTSNYERMRLGYDTTDGYFFLSSEAAGTGTQRGLGFWMQGGLRWVFDASFNLKPWSDNVKDVGSPTLRPKHLYAGTYADLTGGALVTEVPNQTSTGTTLNKLAKVTGSPAAAVIASTSDLNGVIGVVADGAGTNGSAQIARGGQAACVFDGPTTAGDYVQISATTAGDCHDAGASYPGTGQVLGRVLSTNGAGGAYSVLISGGDLQASNGGGAPAGTAGYILTGTGSSSSFSPQALDATQLSGADACAKMKTGIESTINGVSSPMVSGLGFINNSIACANPPFTATDAGAIQLPPGLIAAQNTWLFGANTWLHGTSRASATTGAKGTLIQAQNAGSSSVANPILQMGNATTGNIFGSGADWITLDGNSLAGTIGIQDDYLQEEGGFDRIKIINTTTVGADFGLGLPSIQHGVNLTNSDISASSAEGASCGPAVNGMAITSVSVNTSGLVTATVSSTATLFTRNQALIASVPAGATHSTNFNGFYEITVASGTTFTYSINVTLADTAGSGGNVSTYTLPLRVWSDATTLRPIRNVTLDGSNCNNAFPAGWAGAEFSGKGPILVETLHVEGYPIGIDIGALAATAGVDLEEPDPKSGSATNCLVTGIRINNQFGTPTDIKIHNVTGTGAGCGNPTNLIVDLANGNTITFAHNNRVSQYDLDGSGFPHALLANCADMTKGWCDDGTNHSLWVNGNKVWTVSDAAGVMSAAFGGSPLRGDVTRFAGSDLGTQFQNCLIAAAAIAPNGAICDASAATGSPNLHVSPFRGSTLPKKTVVVGPLTTVTTDVPIVLSVGDTYQTRVNAGKVDFGGAAKGTGESSGLSATGGFTLQASASFPKCGSTTSPPSGCNTLDGTVTAYVDDGTNSAQGTICGIAMSASSTTATGQVCVTGTGTHFTTNGIAQDCIFSAPYNRASSQVVSHIDTILDDTHLILSQQVGLASSVSGATYAQWCPVVQYGIAGQIFGNQNHVNQGINLHDLTIDGNNQAGSFDLANYYAPELDTLDNVTLTNYTSVGFLVGGSVPQTAGPYRTLFFTPGTNCTSNTYDLVINSITRSFSWATPQSFENMWFANAHGCDGATDNGNGILVDGGGTEFSKIHFENKLESIQIGVQPTCFGCNLYAGNTSIPTALSIAQANFNCTTGHPCTDAVKLGNDFAAPNSVKLSNFTSNGSVTNFVNDVTNANIITTANNPSLAGYDLDGGGFAHALLANCADMTKGWCDDGSFNALWIGGSKVWAVNDASGVITAPTPSAGDSSTKLATTAYVQNQTTGIPWLTVGRAGSVSGVTFSTTANQAELWGVVLTFPVTTTEVTYYVGTADNTANSYDVGIYNSSGTLVVHTGTKAGTVFAPAPGATTLSWAASTTLQPGRYYLAITTNCTASCAAIDGDNASAVSFLSKGVVSVSAGGTLNSSLTPPADVWSYSSITPAWAVR